MSLLTGWPRGPPVGTHQGWHKFSHLSLAVGLPMCSLLLWHGCSVSAVSAFATHLSQILMTFENLAAWGPCLCAVCPSPTMIVTSGASAVVCVWELSLVKGRPRGLKLRQVCASHRYGISGNHGAKAGVEDSQQLSFGNGFNP